MDRAAAEELDRADDLARFRDRFPVDDRGPIYMDGNSLGRVSYRVAEAVTAGVEEWRERIVGGWPEWIELPSTVGDRVGELVGAGPGQVLLCDSTTVNLYKLASAALAAAGDRDEIVYDANDFPTDRYVLEGLARAGGRRLVPVPSDPVEGPDQRALAAAISDRTALVCLSHVNYRSAAMLDMAAVTEAAHARGALVVWDLCHSAGAVPVDLDGCGADLAVGCTYKYLNAGPGAPAFLYVSRPLQRRLQSPIWGWFAQADQFAMGERFEPVENVGRFGTGTPPVLGMLAVGAGVDLLLEAGIDRLWAKSRALTAALAELAEERLGRFGVVPGSPTDPGRRGAHLSLRHPDAWSLCSALVERRLVVPDFRAPDSVRLGPAPLYTRFTDVVDAVARIEELLSAGGLGEGTGTRPRVT